MQRLRSWIARRRRSAPSEVPSLLTLCINAVVYQHRLNWDAEAGSLPVDVVEALEQYRWLLVTSDTDRRVSVRRAATGALLHEIPERGVWCLAAIPGRDSRFVTGLSSRVLHVWDAVTGARLQQLQGHTHNVLCVCAMGEYRIASGSMDGTVRVWSLQGEGKCELTLVLPTERQPSMVQCIYSVGDGRLVVGSGAMLHVWAVGSASAQCLRTMHGHHHPVTAICGVHSEGSDRVVSGSRDSSLRVWSLSKGALLAELTGHTRPVTALLRVPDRPHVLSGSGDATIRLWNLGVDLDDAATRSAACIRVFTGHVKLIRALAILPRGQFLSSSDDTTTRIWDLEMVRAVETHDFRSGSAFACLPVT